MFYVLQSQRTGKFFVADETEYREKFSRVPVLCTQPNKSFAWNEANRQNRRTEHIARLQEQVKEREALVNELDERRAKLSAGLYALEVAVDFLKKNPDPQTADILAKLEADQTSKTAELAQVRTLMAAVFEELDSTRRALRSA